METIDTIDTTDNITDTESQSDTQTQAETTSLSAALWNDSKDPSMIYIATDGGCLNNGGKKGKAIASYAYVILEPEYIKTVRCPLSIYANGAIFGSCSSKNLTFTNNNIHFTFTESGHVGTQYNKLFGYQANSNNKGELLAIYKAIAKVESLELKSNIFIISDSMYSINAITQWYPKWVADKTLKNKQNVEIISLIYDKLQEFRKEGRKVHFQYISSHQALVSSGRHVKIWFYWILNGIADSMCSAQLTDIKNKIQKSEETNKKDMKKLGLNSDQLPKNDFIFNSTTQHNKKSVVPPSSQRTKSSNNNISENPSHNLHNSHNSHNTIMVKSIINETAERKPEPKKVENSLTKNVTTSIPLTKTHQEKLAEKRIQVEKTAKQQNKRLIKSKPYSATQLKPSTSNNKPKQQEIHIKEVATKSQNNTILQQTKSADTTKKLASRYGINPEILKNIPSDVLKRELSLREN